MPQMIARSRPQRRRGDLAAPRWAARFARWLLALLVAVSSLLAPLMALPAAAEPPGSTRATRSASPFGPDAWAVPLERAAPGLALDKRLVAPPGGNTTPGNQVVFDVQVTNTGSTVLTTVSLGDSWEGACLQLQGISPATPPPTGGGCTGGLGCVSWDNIGPLDPGQSKTFTFTFLANITPLPYPPFPMPDCTPAMNSANASGTDVDGAPVGPVTDEADVNIHDPKVEIVKTVSLTGQCPGQDAVTVGPGTPVTYCYVATNTGDTHLSNITVTDDKLGVICSPPSVPVLAPGASHTCTQTATITQTTTNVGTASGDPSDSTGAPYPGMPSVSATDTATVDICRAGLGDMVWVDFFISDGIQQSQETLGIPGVPISVMNSSGQQVATAITGQNGKYAVTDLSPGVYTVVVWLAPSYRLTSPGVRTTTLTCGQVDNTMDFGFAKTTAVTFQSMMAQRQGDKTVVSWATSSEDGNEGFHVWRATNVSGPYVRLTSRPVPSKVPEGGGAAYSYTDDTIAAQSAYWYRIESTPDGALFGPVSDTPQTRQQVYLPMLLCDR